MEEENKELLADQKAVRREKMILPKVCPIQWLMLKTFEEIDRLEDELSEAKDDIAQAQKVEPVKPVTSTPEKSRAR